jgi:hypothetical protein
MTIQLNTPNIRRTVSTIDTIAPVLGRYDLVIAWIGALKFTAYEAQGIQPFVANSPFMSWLYEIFTVNTFSALLGVVEITTAVLLAIKPLSPRLSVLGSMLAIALSSPPSPSCSPHQAWAKPPPAGSRCSRRRASSSSKMLHCWDCQPGRWPTLSARLCDVQALRRRLHLKGTGSGTTMLDPVCYHVVPLRES